MTDYSAFMSIARDYASKSPDPSRQAGAVIIREPAMSIVCGDYNKFPAGVKDKAHRWERPDKYKWVEHAERNAIYAASRRGISLGGTTMVLQWYPCADCARAIIQVGIRKLVCIEPDWDDWKWADDFRIVKEMLVEAGVAVVFHTEGEV